MKILWEKIVEFLIESIGNDILDRWRKSSSVDRAILDLRSALERAHLLIERSECWRLPLNSPIDKLLPQLKEAIYEAEIVVDEFAYQGLKNEFEKPSSGTIFLRNWMKDFPSVVKKAFDDLDKISKEMKETCDKSNIPENPNEFSKTARPITSTFPSTTDIYGREKDLTKILNLMGVPRSGRKKRLRNVQVSNLDAGESSHGTNHEGNVSVLSIVGIGGVGKTTLAQMVCNDKMVKSYFDLIMWICVSDNFDLMKLTKEIIESATNKGCDLTNLDSLQKKLKQALSSKSFLLVVDDVWSNEWQNLLGPMKEVREGSIVMVTSRSNECVGLSGTGIASKGIVNLEGLEENIYWEFFKSQAFGSVTTSSVDPELEVIGKEISKRLKGSPLAAKTIGRLLSTSRDVSHWIQIKDSPIWQHRQKESEILPALQLSYQCLPSHLKKCFSYCALYPKDFKFTKWELTKLWIMQGFINLPEQIITCKEPYIKEATEYFHELVQRCFLQKVADCSKDEYVIHDLMHDVCQSITKDECFRLEYEDWEASIMNCNVRHLSIFNSKINIKEQMKLCKYQKLLSMRLDPRILWGCNIRVIDTWCKTLTSIRSLSLPRCLIKLPESIGNLKHLQYLDISFTPIEKLPESFCELYNLVFLNMEGCSEIKSVPEGFSRLVNLRFLYWPAERLTLIYHMENYLREMKNSVREIETKNMNLYIGPEEKIENLKHMNRVGGVLRVFNVENILNKKAAEEAHLKNKPLIDELNLYWSEDRDCKDEGHDQDVLEGLWPHSNLKALKIYDYGGRTLASWFQIEFWSHLTCICIYRCKQLTNLQDCLNPNQFPMLKTIAIRDCENLVSLPVESFGGFGSLKRLTITNCPKLTCLNVMVLPSSIEILKLESISICLRNLNSLVELAIRRCPKLVACSNVMVLPSSIEKLYLESCGELEKLIPSCLWNLNSLVELVIRRCPGLVSIPAEATRNLKSLHKLHIFECAQLQSLGEHAETSGQGVNGEMTAGCKRLNNFQDGLNPNQLPMLRFIQISDCENLVSLSLESFGGFASLKELRIMKCPKLLTCSNTMVLPPSIEELWLEKSIPSCLQNLTSLQVLSISRCPGLVSFPAEATSNLKSLRTLIIENCAELQSLGGLFEGSLKDCNIRSCSKLAETGGQNVDGKLLPAVESFGRFVSLRELRITNCPKLSCSNAMVLPPSIRTLLLHSCGGLEKIIPSLLRNLTSLFELSIERCPGLESIPAEATSNLKSLGRLSIVDCAQLRSVGGLSFLASVRSLRIERCPKLAETGGQDVKEELPPELLSELLSTACGSKRKRE